jgi:signal transduction histidine kinase
MAPTTALAFMLCGTALLLFETEWGQGFRPSQTLVLSAGLIALVALIGYSYRALIYFHIERSNPMSLPSAVAFFVFSLGFLAAHPSKGLMNVIASRTAGGDIGRRLLPMAVIIPWLLGALLLEGEKLSFFESEFGISIFAVSSIIIFSVLIWRNSRLLYRADLDRARTARRLAFQYHSTRILAESAQLEEAMNAILKTACETLGWEVGAMWTADPQHSSVRCLCLQALPHEGLAPFLKSTEGRSLPLTRGLPGRVWEARQAVWVPDVQDYPEFERQREAAEAGLHGAFAVPIQLGTGLFGLVEFFSRRPEPLDNMLLEMMTALGSQVGQFIERQHAQAELRRTTMNLERSNTDLQQFAYVASHDLVEPLRMVSSYLQLLKTRAAAKLDDQANEFIAYAMDGAVRMQNLIKDLLAYSRLDARGRSFEPVNCEEIFDVALTNLKIAIEENHAVVTRGPLPTVLGDPIQLTQLLQNLIGNAIKFHGPRQPEIHVSALRQPGYWRFAVKDNGIGIDPKFFDRIFVIFQRLHTRQEYSGTGIGLAVCKRIIERHGGKIGIESLPGQGSTFWFTLPLLKEQATAAA